MHSPAYRAYRAILTANDPVLASVFTAMEENVNGRGENYFDFLEQQQTFHARVGVYYDNATNTARPTLVMSPDADPADLAGDGDKVAILNDAWFPAGVEWVDRNLVVLASDYVPNSSMAAMQMANMAADFAVRIVQAMDMGMTESDLAEQPRAHMDAQMIQEAALAFSVGYQNGISLRTPPPGARHVPREKWVPKAAGPGRKSGGLEIS